MSLHHVARNTSRAMMPFQSSVAPAASTWRPKMIVFDKDGTLSCCAAALQQWAESMGSLLRLELQSRGIHEARVGQTVAEFYAGIGWDDEARCVQPSAVLSAGTWEEIHAAAAASLSSNSCGTVLGDHQEAARLVATWSEGMDTIHANDQPVNPVGDGMADLLRGLTRDFGLTVAVCTSDSRVPTEQALASWGCSETVRHVVCGDDGLPPKPNPGPLLELCRAEGVLPRDCIVVGDTLNDTKMARDTGAGLAIGVLTGSGTPDQLTQGGAHIILPSVADLPRFLHAVLPQQEMQLQHDQSQQQLGLVWSELN